MADNRASSVQPPAHRCGIPAYRIWSVKMGARGQGADGAFVAGEISSLIVGGVSLGHSVAATIPGDHGGARLQDIRRQVATVVLPLVDSVHFLKKRSCRALSPVIMLLCSHQTQSRRTGVIVGVHQGDLAARAHRRLFIRGNTRAPATFDLPRRIHLFQWGPRSSAALIGDRLRLLVVDVIDLRNPLDWAELVGCIITDGIGDGMSHRGIAGYRSPLIVPDEGISVYIGQGS